VTKFVPKKHKLIFGSGNLALIGKTFQEIPKLSGNLIQIIGGALISPPSSDQNGPEIRAKFVFPDEEINCLPLQQLFFPLVN